MSEIEKIDKVPSEEKVLNNNQDAATLEKTPEEVPPSEKREIRPRREGRERRPRGAKTEEGSEENPTEEKPPQDIKSLEKELKSVKRDLKREQRASKTAERLESEMKVQREDLDNITNAHLVYVLTDKDVKIEQFTQAFTEMFDFGDKDTQEQNFKVLIQHDDAVKFYNGCEYVSTHGKEGWGTDIKMLNRTNEVIYTHTFIYPRFDAGVLIGFTFIIENITNKILLHQMQVKLLAAEKFESSTLDFVSSTSKAVLDTVSYKISAVVKLVVGFIALFLIYASVFEIDEIARGGGSFIPTAKVQYLKNFEGGVLSNIYVTEGDSVKKGQILVKLNPIAHQAKLDENKIRLVELKAKITRLQAEAEGISMDDIPCDIDCDERLLALERNLYNSNKKELSINISKQKEQLKSKESSLVDAKNKYKILNINYNLLFDEYKIKKALMKKKIFTKYELGLLKRELNTKESERKSAKESRVQIKTQIQEIKNGIKETTLTFINKASIKHNETLAEIFRLEETQKTLEDTIKRTVIRSPVNGVVKELFTYTIGSSIQSSAELMSIVPDNYEMIAEVKIKPEEIAKLHIGQEVKLKVTAFDYSIYGDLEGRITNISPDTITDKDTGESQYLIYIKTEKNYLNNNEKYKIKIGMMVNADILVGKKSIMSFLLKPLLKTTQRD